MKTLTPRELEALYKRGTNITQLLRENKGLQYNPNEIIEVAYDLQAGSYIAMMENAEMAAHKRDYGSEIAKTILSLCNPTSVLEAGVGEATTLANVVLHLQSSVDYFGFDLSWSRVAYAKQWLKNKNVANVTLCTGNLFHIPFANNSIDVVYTSHAIEPNGGNEEPILMELFRVARKYLVLLEPGYELANDEAKHRMNFHGYCKNIKGIAESLGYKVLAHNLFPFISNPLNPTAITIIEKQVDTVSPPYILVCPKFKTPLKEIGGMLFSPEALVVYPVIGGIPCLRIENGIFASKYEEILMMA